MIDPATSYEGKVLEYAAAMLASCPTWSSVCGVPVPARERIVLIDGGDESKTGEAEAKNIDGMSISCNTPIANIALRQFTEEEIGVMARKRSGIVAIGITISAQEDIHPAAAALWAQDVFGKIRSEIISQIGTPGKLAKANVGTEQMTILTGTGEMPGAYQTILTIQWKA